MRRRGLSRTMTIAMAIGVAALALAALFAPRPSRAGDDVALYFDRHAEGWFWYRDPAAESAVTDPPGEDVPEAKPQGEDVPEAKPQAGADDPVRRIEAQRHDLEVALDRAILEPTSDHVRAYLALNQQAMEQSSAFAQAWKATLFANPAMDYRQVAPVGSAAYVRADVAREAAETRLADAATHWGLIFFFRGECPYCHRFAPVLRQFADRYGFSVVDVSLDGGVLPEFPRPRRDDGAGRALHVDAVPAVYVVDPATRRIVPAAFGLLGWSDLSERVLQAIDAARAGTGTGNVRDIAFDGRSP